MSRKRALYSYSHVSGVLRSDALRRRRVLRARRLLKAASAVQTASARANGRRAQRAVWQQLHVAHHTAEAAQMEERVQVLDVPAKMDAPVIISTNPQLSYGLTP